MIELVSNIEVPHVQSRMPWSNATFELPESMWKLIHGALMQQAVIAFLIGVCTVTTVHAQHFHAPRSILDYRFDCPTNQVLHRDELYVSYYLRTGVFKFDSLLESLEEVGSLDRCLSPMIFRAWDRLMAFPCGDTLFVLDESNSEWSPIGEYSCISTQGDSTLLAIADSSIIALYFDGSQWETKRIGAVNVQHGSIAAFVVVNDNIVYASEGQKNLSIATLDGTRVRQIPLLSTPSRLFALTDGSVAVEEQGSIHKYLSVDSLHDGGFKYFPYEDYHIGLYNATLNTQDQSQHLIGTCDFPGNDRRDGIYMLDEGNVVQRRTDLDSIDGIQTLVTCFGRNAILSRAGRITIVDSNHMVGRSPWHRDTTVVLSSGVSFDQDGTPILTGYAQVGKVRYPAILPPSLGDNLVLVNVDSVSYPLTRYVHLDDGPEVAVCNSLIFTRDVPGPWIKQTTFVFGANASTVDVLNGTVIVIRSSGKTLVISTDKGLTWTNVVIKHDAWGFSSPTVASSSTLYTCSSGLLSAIDLNNLADTVIPSSEVVLSTIPKSMFSCTDEEVWCMTLRPAAPDDVRPKEWTSVLCYQWKPKQQQLDSIGYELHSPLPTASSIFFSRSDTAYAWDFVNLRLVAVSKSGIVYDTVFTKSTLEPYHDLGFNNIATDNNGSPWLFNSANNLGIKLDPTASVATSIHNYYEELFVEAIHPNPSSGDVRVTLGRFPSAVEEGMQLYLANMTGDVVRNYTQHLTAFSNPSSTQEVSINVKDLPTGMYLLVFANK